MKPLLIVFYSRSGYTRRAALALADAGQADIEEIRPECDYAGSTGILRALRDTLLRRHPRLAPLRHSPAAYRTVLVGGPIWAGRMAAPVRSFVADHGAGCQRLAAFCTMGGRQGDKALDALERLAGQPLAWRAALTDADIDAGVRLDWPPGGAVPVSGSPAAEPGLAGADHGLHGR